MAEERHTFGSWDPAVAADFIGDWEGCRLRAYVCPAGVLTIGYGHTVGVEPNDEITQTEADKILREDIAGVQHALAPYVNVRVSRGQFVALVSLAFNVGVGYVTTKCPKLMRALNAEDWDECAFQFLDITKAAGVELPGLVMRRKEEAALFLEGSA